MCIRDRVGDGDPARLGQPRASAGLLRRMGLPLQSPALTKPRPAVLPAYAASSGRRHGQSQGPTQGRANPTSTRPTDHDTFPASEPRPWRRGTPLAPNQPRIAVLFTAPRWRALMTHYPLAGSPNDIE